MAKFEKGNKYGKGRPTGSRNIITQDLRENFLGLLETNLHKFQEDLDKLEPKDRIKTMIDLAGFVIPKLKAIEYKEEKLTPPPIEITFTEAQTINKALDEKY